MRTSSRPLHAGMCSRAGSVHTRRTENDALESVDALLDGIDRYTRPAPALDAFGAKVFKVSQDEQGTPGHGCA